MAVSRADIIEQILKELNIPRENIKSTPHYFTKQELHSILSVIQVMKSREKGKQNAAIEGLPEA